MKLFTRYKRLTKWNKLFVWGALCSILTFVIWVASIIWPSDSRKPYTTYNIAGDINIYDKTPDIENLAETIKKRTARDQANNLVVKGYSGNLVSPEEGKLYTSDAKSGAQVKYYFKNDKIYAEYITKDGESKGYYELDSEGNLIDHKFPYDLREYELVVPQDLILKRDETTLSNGYKKVHMKLKWGRTVDMILDTDDKLRSLSIKGGPGGTHVSHKRRTITVGIPSDQRDLE